MDELQVLEGRGLSGNLHEAPRELFVQHAIDAPQATRAFRVHDPRFVLQISRVAYYSHCEAQSTPLPFRCRDIPVPTLLLEAVYYRGFEPLL
jgi:hypothetical protein